MANQQSALPDPKATCDPATEEIVDIEFELLDVENDIVAVATVLAERARSVTSLREDLLPPDRLSALGPANRLKLLRKHLSRLQKQLTPDSHHLAEVRNGSNIARSDSVCAGCTRTECPSACQTRLDTYKSKHSERVKKHRMLDVGLQNSPHNRLQQHGIQKPCRRRRQYQR